MPHEKTRTNVSAATCVVGVKKEVSVMSGANILVMSDTHGNTKVIKQLLENYQGQVAAVVHLGDYARDMARFARQDADSALYYIVNGNTDPLVEVYDERVIEVAGKRIFITHGHRYDVKSKLDNLVYRAQELQVDACLFGHTHIAVLFTHKNIVFLNPGSLTYPSHDQERGYGLIRISEENPDDSESEHHEMFCPNITGKLLTYRDPVWQEI